MPLKRRNFLKILAAYPATFLLSQEENTPIANFEIINAIGSDSPCRFFLDGVESQWKNLPFATATGSMATHAGPHKLEITCPNCIPYSEDFPFNPGDVTLIVALKETTYDTENNLPIHTITTRQIPAKPTPEKFSLSFYSVSKKPIAHINYGGVVLQLEPEKLVQTSDWNGAEFNINLDGGATFRVRTDRPMHYIIIICDDIEGKLAAVSTLCY